MHTYGLLFLYYFLNLFHYSNLLGAYKPLQHLSRGYFVQNRILECKRTNGYWHDKITECGLKFPDHKYLEFGSGCFNQFIPQMRNIRILCPLRCHNATDSQLIATTSTSATSTHNCTQFFDFGLTKTHNDIYLWRSKMCLNESVQFQIRCHFRNRPSENYVPREQIPFTLI